PAGAGMPVQWTDNMGNRGEIDYLSQFHTQDYYYPLWIEKDSYTLVGTRLEALNYDKSGNGSYWVNPHYAWGYADNFSPTDFNSSDKANLFKISNAVDFEGKKVNLTHIDFVKVQCAVNAKSGWLGELSTEVCGFYDCSLKNNK
ncbi:MAG: cell surface protein, partial [Rikenellaceae bacterium]|nr:cell surface protein [Rikenellaceae bacterium]